MEHPVSSVVSLKINQKNQHAGGCDADRKDGGKHSREKKEMRLGGGDCPKEARVQAARSRLVSGISLVPACAELPGTGSVLRRTISSGWG